ncbi:MAG: MazG nucleotide pyrophosphohydrolase domain-containing protein [Candidatus Nanohaloarchaea archaeon]
MTDLKELQDHVSEFVKDNDLQSPLEFRILDFVAEAGEIASDAAKSADYGENPEDISVKEDELGDALFSLLTVADSLGIDAEAALERSLEKYRNRIAQSGDPGSN